MTSKFPSHEKEKTPGESGAFSFHFMLSIVTFCAANRARTGNLSRALVQNFRNGVDYIFTLDEPSGALVSSLYGAPLK